MAGIYINSDAWNFWYAEPLETYDREKLIQAVKNDVDYYTAKGGVEAIMYNMNFQRSFYDTKVGTPIWKDCETENGELLLRGIKVTKQNDADGYRMMILRARNMNALCPDFMAVRYRYCREKGVEMWHSMRMNDVHHTPLNCEHRPQHCDLWFDRKDLLRAWYRHTWRGVWHDNAFDYGQQEVFDYHLAMLREYLLDYESDGIELDWLRSIPVFRPGFDELNIPVMTAFMRETRKAANEAAAKWGHPVRVAVRVPGRPNEALRQGMDVSSWAREGLFDILIPSHRDTGSEQDLQIRLWRQLAPAPVILAPCVDCVIFSNPGWMLFCDNDTDFGFASNYYQQGADTLYLYNHFPNQATRKPDMQDFIGVAHNPAECASRVRRHIVTRHNINGVEGVFQELCYPDFIWPRCCNGGVMINAGQATGGRKAKVIIGATVPMDIDVLVNTVRCPLLPDGTPLPRLPEKKGVSAHFVQAEIPADVLHDGWNDVEIFNKDGEHTILASEFVWMEIFIGATK